MRPRIQRQMVFGLDTDVDGRPGNFQSAQKRPSMTWHDHLVMLLHIAAEIEHGLMVQYLYAAYSLGGEQIPEKHRPMVQGWKDSILAIAKEEMGHLLTVQNILTLLGAPINLDREDFPWDTQYYPFPFKLEPLTLTSLACYVFAEMPPEEESARAPGRKRAPRYSRKSPETIARIVEQVRKTVTGGRPHQVGVIYNEIINLLKDIKRIPDTDFEEKSYSTQESWSAWGRGYQPDPIRIAADGTAEKPLHPPSSLEAHVMVETMATRTQALAALQALSAQGEAPHLGVHESSEPSHFMRLVEIYEEFEKLERAGVRPTRNVPINPSTFREEGAGNDGAYIEAERTRTWAELFNLRYRMLLAYLSHAFRLARVLRKDAPNLHGMILHRVFAEMYNLKTIAGLLVQLPLNDHAKDAPGERMCAGPPFEMPYTLSLPPKDIDIWRLHSDLLGSSDRLCHALAAPDQHGRTHEGQAYLKTLIGLDEQSRAWVGGILAGLGSAERSAT